MLKIFYIVVPLIVLLVCYIAYKIYYNIPQYHLFFSMKNNYINKIKVPKSHSVSVFNNVNVVSMDNNRIIKNQNVVIKDGKIAFIGDIDKVSLPANAQIINSKGKYLLPGLIDMHVHVCDENDLLLYLANGITTIRNMWGFKVFGRDLHLEIKNKITEGKILGPQIYTAGNLFDGKPPIWPMATKITSAKDAELAVKKEKEKGYDFIKIYSKLTEENYDALLDAARKYNVPAVGHIPSRVDIDHVLESDQQTIEHLLGYVDPYGRDSSEISPDKYDEYAVKTKASGVWNCPTITVNQYVHPKEENNNFDKSKLKYIAPYMRKYWINVEKKQHKFISKFKFDYPSKSNKHRLKMLRSLNKVKARIVTGTDANMLHVLPGFSIHEEFQNMLSAGLTPYEVIYASTHAAAECLGENKNIGTIKQGKRADLILVEENPLNNITTLKQPSGVMTGGVWLSREKLERVLSGLSDYYN